MFCPLCKSEYRLGFSPCSDCHIPLVATREEAAVVEVVRLWTGDARKQFEGILDALLNAGIPFCSMETVKRQAWPWISIILFQFMKPRPTFEYRIDILHRVAIEQTLLFPKQKTKMTMMTKTAEALSRLTCSTYACSSLYGIDGDGEC
jgi:hypothetical protein